MSTKYYIFAVLLLILTGFFFQAETVYAENLSDQNVYMPNFGRVYFPYGPRRTLIQDKLRRFEFSGNFDVLWGA